MEKENLYLNVYRTQTDKGYGLIFEYGNDSKTLFEPQYKEMEIKEIANKSYLVKTNTGYGLIYADTHKNGSKVLFDPLYMEIKKISNYLYKLKTNIGYGLVKIHDEKSKTLLEPEYKEIEIKEIRDDYYLVKTDVGYGLIYVGYESKILVKPNKENNLISIYNAFAINYIDKINKETNQVAAKNKILLVLNTLFMIAIIAFPVLFSSFWNYTVNHIQIIREVMNISFHYIEKIFPILISLIFLGGIGGLKGVGIFIFIDIVIIVLIILFSFLFIVFTNLQLLSVMMLFILWLVKIWLIKNNIFYIKQIKQNLQYKYNTVLHSQNLLYRYSLLKELKSYLFRKKFKLLYLDAIEKLLIQIKSHAVHMPEHVVICEHYSHYWNIQNRKINVKAKEILDEVHKKFSSKSIVFKRWLE
ncbi:MAG: hypothetical protein IPH52_15605 [Leptospiraceae bacterium]|nr:hypothetical protein [Leptospiraceae bacterium]